VHDRHMYLLTVPFCIVMTVLLERLRLSQEATFSVSVALLICFLVLTFRHVGDFKNETTLYESALKVAPRSLALRGYYALSLLNDRRNEEGLDEFRITTEIAPQSPSVHESYAIALLFVGRDAEAFAEYQLALQYAPRGTRLDAFVRYKLATIELTQNDLDGAVAHLREAISIDPKGQKYHDALSQALRRQGKIQEADVEI